MSTRAPPKRPGGGGGKREGHSKYVGVTWHRYLKKTKNIPSFTYLRFYSLSFLYSLSFFPLFSLSLPYTLSIFKKCAFLQSQTRPEVASSYQSRRQIDALGI